MKKFFTILLLLCLISVSPAQFFEITFDDTTTTFLAPGSVFIAGWLKNISANPLHIKSVRLQNNLPDASWTSSMCIGVCFPNDLDSVSTLMLFPPNPIDPGDSVLIDVVFTQTGLNLTPGTATVLIKYATLHDEQIEYQWFEASSVLSNIEENENRLTRKFKLLNNYPNPFNNRTIISAQINKPSNVTLQIFDVLGREVYKTLRDISSAGQIKFRWSGINNNGEELSSGIYFYRIAALSAGIINQSEIKKLTLLR